MSHAHQFYLWTNSRPTQKTRNSNVQMINSMCTATCQEFCLIAEKLSQISIALLHIKILKDRWFRTYQDHLAVTSPSRCEVQIMCFHLNYFYIFAGAALLILDLHLLLLRPWEPTRSIMKLPHCITLNRLITCRWEIRCVCFWVTFYNLLSWDNIHAKFNCSWSLIGFAILCLLGCQPVVVNTSAHFFPSSETKGISDAVMSTSI